MQKKSLTSQLASVYSRNRDQSVAYTIGGIRMRSGWTKLGAVALMATVAGCGADASSSGARQEFEVKPVAGCEQAWTDPAELTANRQAARCEAGAPAPQPLGEATKVSIAITNPQAELIAPLLWAQERGEFKKENLDVDIKIVPPADALNLLASDKLDAWLSGPDASFHNALAQGYDLRWVAGNYFEPSGSKSGLWTRADNEDLVGDSVGSSAGTGSVIMYPIASALEKEGVSISDVKIQQLASADHITALRNGGIDAAWLLTPTWGEVANDKAYTFVGGQPPAEPLGGIIFGDTLLHKEPEVGLAFLRAYIRTINTTFAKDYKSDPTLVEEIADLLKLPASVVASTPSLIFDWEIREGTSARSQELWHELDVLTYKDPIPEPDLVDRSFYEAVVGHVDN